MIIQRELWLSALHGLPLARQILFLRQRPLKNLAIAFPLTFFWESTVRCRPIVIVARAFAFVGCASCIRRWHFFYADLRGSRLKNRNALLSYWPLYLIGNASIKARPSYSKPRLCHIFFQWVSLATVFGKGTETEYSDEMPTKYEFTWVVRGVLLYFGILRQLVCRTRAYPRMEFSTQEKFTSRRKLRPDFRPDLCARPDPYGPFPLPWLSPPRFRYFFLTPLDQSSLVLILIADLHCLKLFSPIPCRGGLSRALTACYFFFFAWTSSRSEARYFHPSKDKRTRFRDYLFDIHRRH